MKFKISIIFILFMSVAFPQDSISFFSFNSFISIVKNHHPIAYQAGLAINKGEAYLLKSKGGFDPKLSTTFTQKFFDGKQYYSYFNSGLKIPTWFGITAQAGYVNTDGAFINPERQTPENGLWYGGLTVNIGQGLWIDKRRAELNQAKIYVNSSKIKQQLMLNQLIYDASIAYWNWVMAFDKVKVYQQAVSIANKRFNNIKQSVLMGDKAEVDTLKAIIALQDRRLKYEQSTLELNNKRKWLETFLWQDGMIPLVIDTTKITPLPFEYKQISLQNKDLLINIDSILDFHPKLTYYQYDIDMKIINNRLKKEQLKPVIEIKYNALSAPENPNSLGEYQMDNYNWGAKISYPIFTRKERGNLKLSDIDVKEKQADLNNKRAQLLFKIIKAHNTVISLTKQIDIYKQNLFNYENLYNAEYSMFNIGESSLFLVNTREQQLIKAEIKLIQLITSYYQAKAFFNYQIINF